MAPTAAPFDLNYAGSAPLRFRCSFAPN